MTLPIWPITPNWSGGVTETLEWLTDILSGDAGIEQRRQLRRSPRRSFEFTVNPLDEERTLLDLLLTQMQTNDFLLPLWHDKGRLDDTIPQGTTRINFDNAYREHIVGNQAIIISNAFTYEAVTVDAIDDAGITVAAPGTVYSWPAGTAIYPMRESFMSDAGSFTSITPRLGQAQVKFQLVGTNDIDAGDEVLTLYNGSPVFSAQPNWNGNIDFKLTSLAALLDNTTGAVYRASEQPRSFPTQAWSAWARGRAEQFALRQMLYRQAGRAKDLWMPTFNRDVRLAAPVAAQAPTIDIKTIGLGYIGGPQPGRDRIIFPTTQEIAQITGVAGTGKATSERLVLGAPLAHAYPQSALASFLAYSRFDSDSIEIDHAVDSDGPISVSLPIRNIPPGRDPSGVIYYPVPAAVKSAAACGTPEAGSCTTVFQGWYWRLVFTIDMQGGDPDNNGPGSVIYAGPTPPETLGAWGSANTGVTQVASGQWSWYMDCVDDVPASNQYRLLLQFQRQAFNGASCTQNFTDGNCEGQISIQYWDSAETKIVAVDSIFSLYPMYWCFALDGSLATGGGASSGIGGRCS